MPTADPTYDRAGMRRDAEHDTKDGVRVPKALMTALEDARYFDEKRNAERLAMQLKLHSQLHDEKLLRLALLDDLDRAEEEVSDYQRACMGKTPETLIEKHAKEREELKSRLDRAEAALREMVETHGSSHQSDRLLRRRIVLCPEDERILTALLNGRAVLAGDG